MPTTLRSLPYRLVARFRRAIQRVLFDGTQRTQRDRYQELWDWVNGMQQTVNHNVESTHTLERRIDADRNANAEHVDLIVDQLWRRLESADARLATRVQLHEATSGEQLESLATLAGRLRVENAAILRLIGHEEKVASAPGVDRDIALPIPTLTLFNEVERGGSRELTERLEPYVDFFAQADGPIVDLGCGKGDFLQLLHNKNIVGYGVDHDADAVKRNKSSDIDIREEELLAHVISLADDSIGGAFLSQVVEHLSAESILPLYEQLYRVVKPGGVVIAETPNPATFATHAQSFWRDPAHTRPVPSASLDFAARTAGFVFEQLIYTSPTPENDKLEKIELDVLDPLLEEVVTKFNRSVDKLNDLLYGWQDYALVVRKP